MKTLLRISGLLCFAGTVSLHAQQTVTTSGGTVNVVPKYSGAATIINSAIFENGGRVGIGTTAPASTLTVNGTLNASGTTVLDNAFRFYRGNFDGVKTFSDFRSQTSAPNLVISAPGGGVVFNYDHGTGGVQFANGNGGILAQITAAGNAIFAGTGNSSFAGNLGIGTTSPSSKLTVAGIVQSTTGGFKFPDNSVQTTAAQGGLASVSHDATLSGNGTSSSPLAVASPLLLQGGVNYANFDTPVLTVNNVNTFCGEADAICSAIQASGGIQSPAIVAYGGGSDGNSPTGPGGAFTGGYGYPQSAGGAGLTATGGQGGVGGPGLVATGGSATALSSPEAYGGDGIYVTGGTNYDGTLAKAAEFFGNVSITGNLSVTGSGSMIDDPTDPANKYLSHSSVESADMMNIYNGNVVTDGGGSATVTLPEWFEALNRDFRYQLTPIGQPAQAWIATEVANNAFTIKTDRPNVKISWQVTGVRQDAWANAHRIPVEEDKPAKERGYYLHPELYNEPPQKSVQWADNPKLMQALAASGHK